MILRNFLLPVATCVFVLALVGCSDSGSGGTGDPWDDNGFPNVLITSDSGAQTISRSDEFNLVFTDSSDYNNITVTGTATIHLFIDDGSNYNIINLDSGTTSSECVNNGNYTDIYVISGAAFSGCSGSGNYLDIF